MLECFGLRIHLRLHVVERCVHLLGCGSLILHALQHLSELHDLVFVFAQESILGVLIDSWLVLDRFGAVRIPQRRQRLVVVVVSWGDSRDHHGLRVATQRVLQQTGQLGVTIRNVAALPVHESFNNITKCLLKR